MPVRFAALCDGQRREQGREDGLSDSKHYCTAAERSLDDAEYGRSRAAGDQEELKKPELILRLQRLTVEPAVGRNQGGIEQAEIRFEFWKFRALSGADDWPFVALAPAKLRQSPREWRLSDQRTDPHGPSVKRSPHGVKARD